MRNKTLTTQAKEQLFKENRELLEVLFELGGGIMLKEHLISLTVYFYPNKSNIKNNIKELIECGFLKEQQFITSNKYFLYITKYPIAKLQGIQSRNANSINPSYERMANSLFRMEYLITITFPKLEGKEYTIDKIKRVHYNQCFTTFILKNNPEVVYSSVKDRLGKLIMLTNQFDYDYGMVEYEKQALISRISNAEAEINKEHKEMKEKIEKSKALIAKNKQLMEYFNFKNLLSRNFSISGIRYKNQELLVKLSLFDINNSLEVIYLYQNLGYIYMMFNRYFNIGYNDKLKLDLTVYTWSLEERNKLKYESTQKARDFGTGGFKKDNKSIYGLLSSGLHRSQIKDITVDFKSFDFDKKYLLKK